MNLSPDTEDGARNRLVLKMVLGLVAAGALIGIIMGFAGASAIRALGFEDNADTPEASAPTATPTIDPSPSASTPSPTPTPSPTDDAEDEATFETKTPQVSPGERIRFVGKAPELDVGTRLQVQRRETGDDGDWQDFPVDLEVRKNGKFSTWIQTGRVGTWDFRVSGDGFTSPVATVEIG